MKSNSNTFLSSDHDVTIDEAAIDDEILILHLSSDFKTGLLNEIKSLIDLDLVSINENGFTFLRDGWERKLHPSILNDMWHAGWDKEIDTENKFCIHKTIRDAIHAEWKRSCNGWRSRSMPTVRYDDDELERSRQAFESSFEDLMNEMDGIAQFGI